MLYATEASDKIRATITDLRGRFIKQNWESVCASEVNSVWLTDCQSLHDYLTNPVGQGCEDKRLEIDLENLRESLWEYPSGKPKDMITDEQHDKPRWIDTSTMICDPLTKTGPKNFAARLRKTMATGWLDLTPTNESLIRKMQQQRLRLQKVTTTGKCRRRSQRVFSSAREERPSLMADLRPGWPTV